MKDFDEKNSHYKNQSNRIKKETGHQDWGIMDSDYNIKSGCLFGTTEEETNDKQGWHN